MDGCIVAFSFMVSSFAQVQKKMPPLRYQQLKEALSPYPVSLQSLPFERSLKYQLPEHETV
jgi:hypothetical protein